MAEPDIDLADKLVEAIGGLNLGEPFDIERTWLPAWNLITEHDKLQICVQPSPIPSSENGERGGGFETWPMDLGFARRLLEKDRAEIDSLVAKTSAVRNMLANVEVETDAGFHFVTTGAWEYLVRFDPTLLTRTKREDGSVGYSGSFLSVLRIQFRRVD